MTTRSAKRRAVARSADLDRHAAAREARIAAAVSLFDFREIAEAVVEPAAFDYIEGGAWDELTLADNEAGWLEHRLRPRVLVDVSRIDPSTTLLGSPAAFPVAVAPMAAHGLANSEAETATVRAAAAAGIPFIASTMSTCSMEEIAAAAPDATRWFQLYTQADPGRTRSLVERAVAAGYGAIVLTVDLPVLGYRERDRRSGFDLSVPLGNFADGAGGPTHADHGHGAAPDSGYDVLEEDLARNLTWDSLATIREWSGGLPLILKGVVAAEDARLATEHGVDAIVVSNHGGRQLDRVLPGTEALREVVGAVAPGAEIWVDGGVRRGLDIAIALALGARGVLVGRPILWALAAGGETGVTRAIAILREEFEIALALLGTPTPADVTPDHIVR